MFFKWMDKYAVGIDEIDQEHKVLVQSIDELYLAMHEDKSSDQIPALLKKLADYTLGHFSTEQTMMVESNYPRLQEHLSEHQVMRNKIADMQSRHAKGKLGISIELMIFLRGWLNNHILDTDHAFATYLKSLSSGGLP